MLELQLVLPAGAGKRSAIEAALRDAIRARQLPAGSKLPSSRVLASDLGVSRSTVVGAYEQLGAEGYLTSLHGRGTVVAALPATASGSTPDDLMGPYPTWDFRPGEPDASKFPRREWLQSLRRVMTNSPTEALTYPDPRGRPELRAVLAAHLARTRSVVADPAGMFVYGGFAAALGFVADAFMRQGIERVAVEEALLPFHRVIFRMAGLEIDVVPVDDEGLDVDALAMTGAQAVLVTPANHYPYCIAMSAARRAQLVAWAEDNEAWIIEDDYDGEFRYEGRPIGALQGLAPHRVIYGGTASKSLGAGLRLGWIAVPEPLRQPLTAAANMRSGVSAIDQLALANFIERGLLDRHVRQMRRYYDARRRTLIERLTNEVPSFTPAPSAAGLHLRVPTSPAVERAVLKGADTADVGLLGLSTFHHAPPERAGLTVGFSRPPEHAFAQGLDRLISVLSSA